MNGLRDNDEVLEYIKDTEHKVRRSIKLNEQGVEYWTDQYNKDRAELEELIKQFNETVKKVKSDQRNLEFAKGVSDRFYRELDILCTLKFAYLNSFDDSDE